MSSIITNVFSIKLRKLSSEYKTLYTRVRALQEQKKALELDLVILDNEIFKLNRQIDALEEEILHDLEYKLTAPPKE